MNSQIKANYLLFIFNNDKYASIRLCDRMISTCILESEIQFYKQVK